MSRAIAGHEIGKQVADALGLERPTDIKIHIPLDDVVLVEVKYFPDKEHMDKLIPILAKYNLVPKKENNGKAK